MSGRVPHRAGALVYQSRSGPPQQAWLEPDVKEYLKELKNSGVSDVVIAPIGFISDHMEVIYDLDVEAMELCGELGLHAVRASTAGVHPAFVSMIRELILERTGPNSERRFLGDNGSQPDVCPIDCCPGLRQRALGRLSE